MGRIEKRIPAIKYLFLVLLVCQFLFSCKVMRPVPYFNGKLDTTRVGNVHVPEQKVQVGDVLSITIYSDDPAATSIYNQAGSGGISASTKGETGVSRSVASSGAAGTPSYLVDMQGNIRMHALGLIHVEGMTKKQLSDTIVARLNSLGVLLSPYCVINFSNFRVSVLGEVKNPGVFTVPAEKASVLEVLAMAGDITDFGLKHDVMLIREENGKRTFQTLNLLDQGIFESPDFFLRQNDVLVVKADEKKPTAAEARRIQNISLALAVVSTLTILASVLR